MKTDATSIIVGFKTTPERAKYLTDPEIAGNDNCQRCGSFIVLSKSMVKEMRELKGNFEAICTLCFAEEYSKNPEEFNIIDIQDQKELKPKDSAVKEIIDLAFFCKKVGL